MAIESNSLHIRVHESILAGAEKRTLHWLAHRMPAWINSGHLTVLGLARMILAGGAYWASSWDRRALVVVVIALAVN